MFEWTKEARKINEYISTLSRFRIYLPFYHFNFKLKSFILWVYVSVASIIWSDRVYEYVNNNDVSAQRTMSNL